MTVLRSGRFTTRRRIFDLIPERSVENTRFERHRTQHRLRELIVGIFHLDRSVVTQIHLEHSRSINKIRIGDLYPSPTQPKPVENSLRCCFLRVPAFSEASF